MNNFFTPCEQFLSIVTNCFPELLCTDNEMVRRQFAEKANQVGPWIERQMDAVTAIGMGLQVSNHSLHCGSMLNESVGNNGQSVLWMSKKFVE